MTIIAYDGKTLAADGMSSAGDVVISMTEEKILVGPDVIFASTGCYALFIPLIRWFCAGAKPADFPKMDQDFRAELIVIGLEGPIFSYKGQPYADEFDRREYITFGSGWEIGLGALHSGKTAEETVALVSSISSSCGGKISSINVDDYLRETDPIFDSHEGFFPVTPELKETRYYVSSEKGNNERRVIRNAVEKRRGFV